MGHHTIAHRPRGVGIQQFAARLVARLGGIDPDAEPTPKPVADEWDTPDAWGMKHARKAGA